MELHSGWLNRQRRSVPRDRIRTVDLTAKLLHRAFGLSVVQVSAGAGASAEHSGLSLDAVSQAEAERLRRELLDRSPTVRPGQPGSDVAPPVQELARLRLGVAAAGPADLLVAGRHRRRWPAPLFNLIDDLGIDPRDIGPVDAATDRLTSAPALAGRAGRRRRRCWCSR